VYTALSFNQSINQSIIYLLIPFSSCPVPFLYPVSFLHDQSREQEKNRLRKTFSVSSSSTQSHICTNCGKSFRAAIGLFSHKRTHRGSADFTINTWLTRGMSWSSSYRMDEKTNDPYSRTSMVMHSIWGRNMLAVQIHTWSGSDDPLHILMGADLFEQESRAIAKMTARCALFMDAVKILGVPGYAHGYFYRNC